EEARVQELLAERRADRDVRELLDREWQRAELEDGDEVGGLLQRVAADPARRDLDVPAGDRVLDLRRRDDPRVEDDREIVADVLRRVVAEQFGALILEDEGDHAALRRVLADRRRIELLAAEQRRGLLGVDDVVDVLPGASERDG